MAVKTPLHPNRATRIGVRKPCKIGPMAPIPFVRDRAVARTAPPLPLRSHTSCVATPPSEVSGIAMRNPSTAIAVPIACAPPRAIVLKLPTRSAASAIAGRDAVTR